MPTRISIITPSFNQGQFIEQTIKSVLSQNYPDLEYIVMDGGSTDDTLTILKKYENRLKWFSQKDKGQSDAINKGLRMATGDIVAWLNSDDYYLPETLSIVGEFFEKNPQAQWLSGDYKIVNEKNEDIHSFVVWYKRFLRFFNSYTTLSFANYIIQPSTFWRKKLLTEVGYLHEKYRYCMDYDLWLRCMKKYPPYVISSPLSAFRIHQASKGGVEFKKQFEEELQVAKKNNISGYMYKLHKIHNSLIHFIYSVMK